MRVTIVRVAAVLNSLILILMLTAVVAGCSSSERKVEDVAVTASPTDNPDEQFSALDKDLRAAREHNVHVLSPTWFASAEKSFNRAKEIRNEGGNYDKMFGELAQCRAQLDRANYLAKKSETELADVIKTRQQASQTYDTAVKSGALDLENMKDDYNRAEKKFRKLAIAVEDNDLQEVRDHRGEVMKAYRDVETTSLRKGNLDNARLVVQEAIKQGAKKHAPKTLQTAQQTIDAADKYIAANPNESDEIAKKADDAKFFAARALAITQHAKEIADKNPEDTVLWFEQSLAGIGEELGAEDLRSERMEKQVTAIRTAAHDMKGRTAGMEQMTNKALSQEEQLRQNERIAAIAQSFDSEEAEVLQKGNNVLIRLKGIQFPVGQSRLGSENFALLGKVQKVIEQNPQASVKVEGHTDATGSNASNTKLSQKRAEAVKEYLVNSAGIADSKVSAVGMGFNEPIASNRTKAGRAANRRIDVVIQMEPTPATAE